MKDDRKTLLAALNGRDFVFAPSRLAIASDTLQEWLASGDVPDDVRDDFTLARDCVEALYTHITLLPDRA